MNTSLDHLPERKRQQLRAIAAAVQAKVNVEMIILNARLFERVP